MSRRRHQPPPSAAQVQFVSCWKEASREEDGEPLSFDISTFYWKKLFFSIEFRILLGTRATLSEIVMQEPFITAGATTVTRPRPRPAPGGLLAGTSYPDHIAY